jgi:hypothetical protein
VTGRAGADRIGRSAGLRGGSPRRALRGIHEQRRDAVALHGDDPRGQGWGRRPGARMPRNRAARSDAGHQRPGRPAPEATGGRGAAAAGPWSPARRATDAASIANRSPPARNTSTIRSGAPPRRARGDRLREPREVRRVHGPVEQGPRLARAPGGWRSARPVAAGCSSCRPRPRLTPAGRGHGPLPGVVAGRGLEGQCPTAQAGRGFRHGRGRGRAPAAGMRARRRGGRRSHGARQQGVCLRSAGSSVRVSSAAMAVSRSASAKVRPRPPGGPGGRDRGRWRRRHGAATPAGSQAGGEGDRRGGHRHDPGRPEGGVIVDAVPGRRRGRPAGSAHPPAPAHMARDPWSGASCVEQHTHLRMAHEQRLRGEA